MKIDVDLLNKWFYSRSFAWFAGKFPALNFQRLISNNVYCNSVARISRINLFVNRISLSRFKYLCVLLFKWVAASCGKSKTQPSKVARKQKIKNICRKLLTKNSCKERKPKESFINYGSLSKVRQCSEPRPLSDLFLIDKIRRKLKKPNA